MLSARFVTVKAKVDTMLETSPALTGEQIEGIFRRALEDEPNGLLNDAYANEPWSELRSGRRGLDRAGVPEPAPPQPTR